MTNKSAKVKFLKRIAKHRITPPTMSNYIDDNKGKYVFFIMLFVPSAIMFWYLEEYPVSTAIAGYLVGVLYRDFQWVRVQLKAWPTYNEVIDWEKVDSEQQTNTEEQPSQAL